MYDHDLFVETTAGFSEKLLSSYDLDEVLTDLADRLARLLSLTGAGISLGMEGELRAVTMIPPSIEPVERHQEEVQDGPCCYAFTGGEPVTVPELREETRWASYRRVAAENGMRAVAAVPMKLRDETVGAINMYNDEPREWPPEDIGAARVLANMATAYLINASTLAQQTQLSQQLQRALDTRVVIEQAKGILAQAHGIGVEEAFQRIRRFARGRNANVHKVADAVVNLGVRF